MANAQVEDVKDEVEEHVGNGGGNGMAKRILVPAAAGLGTLAATYAARKAPELLRDRVMPKAEEEGGKEAAKIAKNAAGRLKSQGGIAGKVAGKAAEKLGGGGGREKTRRLPIQRWTDIAVPVQTAFEKWTEFEEFPKFMHRVLSVEQPESDRVTWEEKIWFSKRQWEGEITERRKNDRIAWKTVKGTSHSGIVSFHRLDTNLTRVMVTLDFHPSGMIEKMASGLRFVKRAVQADLARFKAYVELGETKGLEYTHETETNGGEKGGRKRRAESESNGGDDERAERKEERRS